MEVVLPYVIEIQKEREREKEGGRGEEKRLGSNVPGRMRPVT
jgi:hypothetical protein